MITSPSDPAATYAVFGASLAVFMGHGLFRAVRHQEFRRVYSRGWTKRSKSEAGYWQFVGACLLVVVLGLHLVLEYVRS